MLPIVSRRAAARRLPAALLLGLAVASPLLATPPALASPKGPRPSDIVLSEGFPPLDDAHRSLASVPFAPGAPAVVLLDATQVEFEENHVRARFARRIKILTEAGAGWGDHVQRFTGEWRLGKIHARTILADGTAVDAADNVHVETSKDPDITTMTITFPRVQPGTILDLAYTINVDGMAVNEQLIQEGLPVLENRFLIAPPPGWRFRTALSRLTPEEFEKREFRHGLGTMHAWIFRDVPPLPQLPHLPPRSDIAKKLLLVPETFRAGSMIMPLASDWKVYTKDMARAWDDWLKRKSSQAATLAAPVLAAAPGPREKAEAVRQLLRDRMSVAHENDFPSTDTPDEALAQGSVNTADIAGVAIAMLRSAGLPAHAAAYRYRSSGTLPAVPAPSLLDDVLVVVPGAGAGGDLYFSAWSELPVGLLPLDALGVQVVPLRKDSPGPTWIPDVPADDNALDREVTLDLALDGTIRGEAVLTARGPIAREWRTELRLLSEAARKESLHDLLRTHAPTAQISAWEIRGLDEPSKDLVVSLHWEARGWAQRAGGRMLINPFLFDRFSAGDWGAETRDFDVWLGRPHRHRDTVTVRLPEGVASVQLPGGASLVAGETGGYTSSYSGKDRTLTATRNVRFATTFFLAGTWSALKQWFQDMAAGDDQSIVLTLGETAP